MRPSPFSARCRLALAAGLATALASVAGATACRWLSPAAPPPAAPGVVLVLADGFGGDGEASRTAGLRDLAATGRRFEAAFAPSPRAEESRGALIGSGDRSLAALFRARGAAVAAIGEPPSLPVDARECDLRDTRRMDDPAVLGRLEAWLRARSGPFLALVSVGGGPPLGDGLPPATLAGAFAPPLPRIAVDDLAFTARPGGEVHPPSWSAPARARAEAVHLERSLAADAQLSALAATLLRACPRCALVVVGDPPPDLGAHGRLTRSVLFDDTLRSALVVATPGIPRRGEPTRRLVSTLDVAPTLLALAGLAPADGLPGRSLVPLLTDPTAAGHDVLSSVPRRAGRIGRSARSLRWRYTEWPDGSEELYDHAADPGEIRNLADRPEQSGTVREMKAALGAPAPVGAPGAPAAPSRPRSVLLVMVDDLTTRVGAWGAPVRTPNIDRLSRMGVRFERAYVPVAMCSPSRTSMLTGWLPERTGVWQNWDPPRPAGARPLQEHFAAQGIVTASVGKIYHSPRDFRWDVQESHPTVTEDSGTSEDGAEDEEPRDVGRLWVEAAGDDLDQPDGQRAARGAQLLTRFRRRTFFLAVGFVRPHERWIAPARYFGFYPPASVTLPPFVPDDLADVPAIAVKTKPQPLPGLPLLGREPAGLAYDPDFLRHAIAAYEACTTFADAQVGVLLDALDRLDLWKSTVVVLVGDNGFHLGEHGGLLRKDTLFEEALHVPLVVVAPGLPHPGAVVAAPVGLVDLYPTIVDLAGLPAVPGVDGRSLVPLLLSPEAPDRAPAVSYRRVSPPERAWSLRTEALRYTLWPDGSEELYDLRSKRGEADNLAGSPGWAGEKARLRSRLESLVAR